MRYILPIILILIQFECFSQSDTIIDYEIHQVDTSQEMTLDYFSITFDQKIFFSDFQNQLKNFQQYDIAKPCNYISLALIDKFRVIRGNYIYPGYFMYSYLLPYRIATNDTITSWLKGYNFRFSIGGVEIIDKNHFEMSLTTGLTFGRLRIVNENKERMKNANFGPFVGLILKAKFKRLSIFSITQVDYDFSSKKWKKLWFSKEPNYQIQNLNQSGSSISFGINYDIKNNN